MFSLRRLLTSGSKATAFAGRRMVPKRSGLFAKVLLGAGLTTAFVKYKFDLEALKSQNLGLVAVAQASENLHQVEIGGSDEFQEGQLKEIKVGDDKKKDLIMVVRYEGQLYAVGAKCTHVGAPLAQGILFEDRIYCPWHLAAFSIKTGYPDNGPILNGLPVYKITEKNGKVTVEVPKSITVNAVPVKTVTRDPANKERYVIVGGGPAGTSAVDTLRQAGFTGEIVVLSKEEVLPYDRTALTKGPYTFMVMPHNQCALRDQDYFDKLGVEVRSGAYVVDVNPEKKTVELKDGEKVKYDKLLIATGASPFVPPIPGTKAHNVFPVRDFAGLEKIRGAVANAKNVVVIGASFIGVESAGSIKGHLKDEVNVTVVDGSKEAYERALGPKVGKALRVLGEKSGVTFKFGTSVKEINQNEEGYVSQVVLADGTKLDADLVIMGTGVRPNTWFLKDKVGIAQDGGVRTDVFLRSSDDNIFAAGDVASFPYFYNAERIRVEHIAEAYATGYYAALNMLGKYKPYDNVPFFSTRAFNKTLAYIGHAKDFDDVSYSKKHFGASDSTSLSLLSHPSPNFL